MLTPTDIEEIQRFADIIKCCSAESLRLLLVDYARYLRVIHHSLDLIRNNAEAPNATMEHIQRNLHQILDTLDRYDAEAQAEAIRV